MNLTVVLIDDNLACNHLHNKLITMMHKDANVQTFSSSIKGLEFIKENTHENMIIFLDINMPNLNGFEILQEIQETRLTNIQKINILSSSSDQTEIDKCKAIYSNCEFIEKPLTFDKIKDCLA